MKIVVAMAALLAAEPAYGASAEYCRPYAAQTAEILIKYFWLRAYTSCLNSDEDPPPAKAASDAVKDIALELAPPPPLVTPPPPKVEAPKFDPDAVADCKRYYRTFRISDGTVIRRGSKRRVMCPQLTRN